MAIKANLVIDQGTSYSTTIFITDDEGETFDLSSYSAVSELRKHFTSTNAVSFGTSIDANAGSITVSLGAPNTAAITAGRYVYDVKIYNSGNTSVLRVVEGEVNITPQVTQ